MAPALLDELVGRLRAAAAPREAGVGDGELLERFLAHRDEAAFEELLRRHGPMVLRVCRRILGNGHDAADAFQATFLVLVRRGSSVRPRGMVGNFLHGVARHTALEARRAAARRRAKEARVTPRTEATEDAAVPLDPVLDQALGRLPERYRAPLLLCDLGGKTRKEAAEQLGWPEGTVSSRLSRGRALLAGRLRRLGLTFSLAGTFLALNEQHLSGAAPIVGGPPACPPGALIVSTCKAALLVCSSRQAVAAGLLGPGAAALTEKVVTAMWWKKCTTAAAVLLTAVLAGLAGYQAVGAAVPKSAPQEPARPQLARADAIHPRLAAHEAEEKEPEVSVKQLPPVVVKTVPQAGDTQVDAGKVKEIRVTFSKDMLDNSWSWAQISAATFPKLAGKIHYEKDKRTCVLPVKLEPGKTYVLWINSEKFRNFKDEDGRPGVAYQLVFQTKP
jgi:RNA polymerase sigma-70 factor (ECF subfamily)